LSGRSALLTYEPYYGLREKPFSLSVDPHFLYKSRSHTPIFDDLLAGIRRREGLIVLTGDIGTGKTTLCRAVLDHLDRKTFTAFVPDPFVSREDLLKMLLIDFGVMDVDDLKSGRLNGSSRPELSYPLCDFLKSLVPLDAFAVLIIDEAQNLSASLLEEIRILSDLQAPEKLLQVVLVGQLELQAKLKLPEMRQVDQRVSVRCNLAPLDLEAVDSYIVHRLQVAGGTPDRVSFGAAAVDLIAERSGGVPRIINLICDRSLHRGHLARAPLIDSDIVRVAMMDLGLTESVGLPIPAAFEDLPPPEDREDRDDEDIKAAELAAAFPSESEKALREPFSADPKEQGSRSLFPTPALELALSMAPPAPPAIEPAQKKLEPPVPADDKDCPWMFDSRDTRTEPASDAVRGWKNRGRQVSLAMLILALIAGAAFGRAQWAGVGVVAAPEPPASPLESFALNFVPRRQPERATVTPDAGSTAPLAPAAAATAESFVIDVALFSSSARAVRLVADLTAAHYRAYVRDLQLGDRGHLYQVKVGPFASRAAADAEMARIHATPGYADARVVSSAP
jgi:type II secretory pathway predicted ATPase ExeA